MSFAPWYGPGGAQGNLYPRHPWDKISLGGQVIPCHKAKITGGGLVLSIDRKKTLGGNGAHPTYHGLDPQPLTIEVEFTTVEQIRDFAEMMTGIGPGLTDAPVVPIEAQALQHLGCLTSVKIRGVSSIEGDAIKRCKLTLDHWLNPPANKSKSATVTPKKPVQNIVTEAAAKKANPKPSEQAGFCGSPNQSVSP